jgi:hypothetical protein
VVAGELAQMGQRGGLLPRVQLGLVPAPELGEALRNVAVPFAQLGRWRDRFSPFVERGPGLGEPARPEPIDQDAQRLLAGGIVVHPPDADLWLRH